MARMIIKTIDDVRYVSVADNDATEATVKNFADMVARIQSSDSQATMALEFYTDDGVIYIMPAAVVAVARVEE